MSVRIAFLGNLDNGKSTTLGRLLLDTDSLPKEKMAEVRRFSKELGKEVELAFLTDQFEEERRDGLTLDTAQAVLKTRSGEMTLIDVPGHEELIRNMVSGASQAAAAVLVLDVNEGLTDQAKRHLFLARFLGIDPVFVAVNKMDSVSYEEEVFARVQGSLLRFFEASGLRSAGIVPISAKEGENTGKRSARMKWYKGPALLALLEKIPSKHGEGTEYFQFPVQDVYPNGAGKVLVGRIDSGEVRKGQKIAVFPSGREAVIEEVKVFGKKINSAGRGESIGLVLEQGVAPKRGDILHRAGAELPVFDRLENGFVFWVDGESLRTGGSYLFRCATQETACTVEKIRQMDITGSGHALTEANELGRNRSGFVSLRFDRPVVLQNFDRAEELGKFVIEKDGKLLGFGVRKDSD